MKGFGVEKNQGRVRLGKVEWKGNGQRRVVEGLGRKGEAEVRVML